MARLLVIDDEPLVRRALKLVLKRAGHEVACAANGEEGVTLFASRGADLAIVDLMMPHCDGRDTIAALRGLAPDLPIVLITGGVPMPGGNQPVPRTAGADRRLDKPFAREDLLATIDELLDE